MKTYLTLLLALLLTACSTTPTKEELLTSNAYVQLIFDVNEQGHTENIAVIESSHNGFFDNKAIEAIKKWKYRPKVVDGKAVKKVGEKAQLEFKITNK
ncbi:energy transducer TonB [Pseudoalteromonas luteoviolacea]|uniref:TonB C-terminal domain-containing protein n=1 Tax=Pseudoalteromonas luteoviolacea S4054 TaxID=1129367 RepID=A0A0F6AFG1_9GAMM|nr:energy transducer TonB [Pseudoalteromonas luteoviolacea]AOT11192.1 hypothetical protein S4054249_25535 [Pseudoalteromonas luteoviolacea]AOT15644.1 hypothetical protein S40542_22975 [Pseudoalteromonas luteoviolacea]AOT21013.1 hypothetical protein S4054_25455 [Pseudoalteromonas luteoviolacea]KKE84541.1 hypothetical protein N479_08225 [Pseudoalteromonas luteoviolacea S4054]KZN71314.1 hypothetical protein N481_19195 [Pseudoalteromonas luteoviolacea S4047-1]